MAHRSPALVVLSLALISVGGARTVVDVASAYGGGHRPSLMGSAVPDGSPEATALPPSARVIVPEAETRTTHATVGQPQAEYADMAAIYASLPAGRAATLVARLPTEDAAALLRAMPRDGAGFVLGELNDDTAIALTLAMARLPN